MSAGIPRPAARVAAAWVALGLIGLACPSLACATDEDTETLNRSLRQEAILGETPSVESLIARGAEINSQAPHGESALEYAVRFGRYKTAARLLKLGANPDIEDESGRTPLDRAAGDCGASHMTELLLGAGAEINHRDFYGRTALMSAVHGDCVRTVALLLLHSPDRIDLDAHDDEMATVDVLARGGLVSKMLDLARAYRLRGVRGGLEIGIQELTRIK